MTYILAPLTSIGMTWAMVRVAVDPALAEFLARLAGG